MINARLSNLPVVSSTAGCAFIQAIGGEAARDYTAIMTTRRVDPVMRAAFIAIGLLCAAAGTAFAGPCEEELSKVDEALKSPDVAPDIKAQAQDMRKQAADLCSAGNEAEGTDVLAEAEALLGIE